MFGRKKNIEIKTQNINYHDTKATLNDWKFETNGSNFYITKSEQIEIGNYLMGTGQQLLDLYELITETLNARKKIQNETKL